MAERWNHLRINKPGKINRTLRHTLLIFVLDTLLARLAGKESLQNAARQGWLVSQTAPQAETAADAQWAYMMWKETKRQAAPELKEQFIKNLGNSGPSGRTGLILRFSATRPLTAEMSGHSVTLLLESLQDLRASQIMQMMRKWYSLGAWLPVGARLRPTRVERSPLHDEGNPGACVRTRPMMEASNSPVPQTLPLIAGALMNLRLSNPTNLSYLHSVIHLMLYVLPLMPTALQPAGMLLTALKALDKHQGKPVKILDMLLWRIILREWQHIHMQQDCAELFKHVMDRCRIPALIIPERHAF